MIIKKNNHFVFSLVIGLCLLIFTSSIGLAAVNIDSINKWAWGTNVGWVNFSADTGGVTVYADHLEGYAWGENIGWIRLGTCESEPPCTYANTSASNYGVNNDGAGNLSGFAWSSNVGWINFDPEGGEQVKIDPSSGDFSGYAWGENIGWISFQNTNVPYKVNTTWQPDPPVADAGEDQQVKVSTLVTLDGSSSYDPDNQVPLTYLWTQTAGEAVSLSGETEEKPTFNAPDHEDQLTFNLQVADALGLVSVELEEVTVLVELYSIHLPLVTK